MRTIGAKNKRLVKVLVNKAKRKGLEGIKEITEYVIERLPEQVFDTWEGAYAEIENLISDLVFESNMPNRKDIKIQICEYLTQLKRPITEKNIGFAYQVITGKLLTMRELTDLSDAIEIMLSSRNNPVTWRDIPDYLKRQEPFISSSVTAMVGRDGVYRVSSYETLILELSPTGEVLYFDDKYYSATTSKIQSLIKRVFG